MLELHFEDLFTHILCISILDRIEIFERHLSRDILALKIVDV